VGWAVLYLVLGVAITVVLGALAMAVSGGPGNSAAEAVITGSMYGLIGFGFATWFIGHKVLRLSWTDLRWKGTGDIAWGFGGGVVLGVVPAACAILASLPTAGAELVADPATPGSYLGRLGLTLLVLLPAALLEEMIFRGVGQVALAKPFGRIPTIIALAVLFAAAHLKNDNTTALGIFNIALAGIFLGLVFYLPGGIWTAWGAHFGWNATLAAFDAPVSGLPFPIPAIDYHPGSPSWVSGGSFGPEGGILASVAILLAIGVTYRMLNHSKESA
jgi:membrane protease YdiL (CAAX protease family)